MERDRIRSGVCGYREFAELQVERQRDGDKDETRKYRES